MKTDKTFILISLLLIPLFFSFSALSQSGNPEVELDKDTTKIRNVLHVGDSLGVSITPSGTFTARDSGGYIRYELRPATISSYSPSGQQDTTGANQIVIDTSARRIGMFFGKGFIMEDDDGKLVNMIGYDTTYLKTKVELGDGLRIPFKNGGLLEIDPESNSLLLNGPEGDLITRFDTDGSYHARLERHPGGIEVPHTDGGSTHANPDGLIRIVDHAGEDEVELGGVTNRLRRQLDLPGGLRIPSGLPAGGPYRTETDADNGLRVWDDGSGERLELLPDNGMTMWDPGGEIDVHIGPGGSTLPGTTELEGATVSSDVTVNSGTGESIEINGDRINLKDNTDTVTGYFEASTGNGQYAELDAQRVARVGSIPPLDEFSTEISSTGGIEMTDNDNGWELDLTPDNGMIMWDPGAIETVRIGPTNSQIPGTCSFYDVMVGLRLKANSTDGENTEISGGGLIVRDQDDNIVSSIPHNGPGIFNSGISAFDNGSTASVDAETITANTITASTKNFRIDHPLDPANKWLYHTSMESSERLNMYNGNVVLDANGEATIDLPDWFMALNENYRYQLTAIGSSAPGLFISKEVSNNKFSIAGGTSGLKVSWQISGTRKDSFAKANPTKLEELKPLDKRGTYHDSTKR